MTSKRGNSLAKTMSDRIGAPTLSWSRSLAEESAVELVNSLNKLDEETSRDLLKDAPWPAMTWK